MTTIHAIYFKIVEDMKNIKQQFASNINSNRSKYNQIQQAK